MKIKLLFLIFSLLITIFSGCANKKGKPEFLTGEWIGSVGFEHFIEHYNFRISFHQKGNYCQIDYPDINCGGVLFCDSVSSRAYYFRQKILYGHNRYPGFMNNVIISKTDSPGVLYAQFLPSYNASDSLAFGHLEECDTCKIKLAPIKWPGMESIISTFENNITIWFYAPTGYHVSNQNIGEETIITLSYPDSSKIILRHGSPFDTPILKPSEYIAENVYKDNTRESESGIIKDSLYWREDKILNPRFPVSICFTDVPNISKKLFEAALDRIFIKN